MTDTTLPPDASLADVARTLLKPDDYVSHAYWNMKRLHDEHGEIVLRIGRMGTGKAPHYRLDKPTRFRLFDEGEETVGFAVVAAFNGRNHQALVQEGEEPEILRDEHWSTTGSTLQEVEDVFRGIRGLKR
jgi:hypothetical protein